jgi:putative ABC transport system ATP-binding protein
MRRSVDEYGQTIVMVTHDARAAASAHRVLFLADGESVRELGECSQHEILTVMEEVAAA